MKYNQFVALINNIPPEKGLSTLTYSIARVLFRLKNYRGGAGL